MLCITSRKLEMKNRIFKYITISFVILLVLLVTVVKFSAVETRFECKGNITANNIPQESTIYIILNEYRWWVGLWSKSDGDLKFEIPNITVGYYTPLYEVGEQLQIYDGEKIAGNFSKLSHALALKVSRGFFDGTCKVLL